MPNKKIAISQSNYVLCRGYFELINSLDEFTFYDDTQFTKRDWRSRKKIKTQQASHWLTISGDVKGKYYRKINQTQINNKNWEIKYWQQIKQNCSEVKYFIKYKDIFEELYLTCDEEYLSEINYKFIVTINEILEVNTKILGSSNPSKLIGGQTEKLLNTFKQCNAHISRLNIIN
jgi:hypothetical protein